MSEKSESIVPKEVLKIDSENVHESELMRQCFNIVGVFVAAFDLDGNITMINRKAGEILSRSETELQGRNFIDEFVVNDKKEATQNLFNEIISGKEYPESARFHLISASGEKKIIIANNITIRDKNDEISGILISGKDVTDFIKNQRNLQNDIKLYRRLANNIPKISLFLFDENLRFIIAEGKEMKNVHLSSGKLESNYLHDLKDRRLRSIWTPIFMEALEGNTISTEYKIYNNYYAIWAFPLKTGKRRRSLAMAIIQNVTSEKLKQIRLEESVDEAEKENREKSDFFARVTHEIRTPLNAIMGFTEQLMQTELDDRQDEYVKIIDKSSEHLVALINDVLFLSKIEASEIRFDESPFKIESVVKYVHSALLKKADEKDLTFKYHIDKSLDRVVLGDAFRLRQILINLLNNAIKFTESGSVNVYCYVKEETGDSLRAGIDVVDTGIGIKEENLNKIFDQFQQADSSITNKYGGTGLGLTICKKLIEMQDGSLSVSSQENIGTTFSFEIPYKTGKADEVPSSDSFENDKPDLSGKKVLLVDDDSVNRLLGKIILEKMNCKPDIANSGEDAISYIDRNKYDIVLLDIHMPGISGLDVAQYIRKKIPGKSPGIIAVTAAVMREDIRVYYNAGINDFLIKPYKESNLYNKIIKLFDNGIKQYDTPKSKKNKVIIGNRDETKNGYDLTELKQMAGENQEFIDKMILTFIQNSEDLIEKFRLFLPGEKWEEIGEAAHKVLPSYRHLKIDHIVRILTKIKNKTLLDSDYNAVPPLINSAIEEIERLLPEIKKEIKH